MLLHTFSTRLNRTWCRWFHRVSRSSDWNVCETCGNSWWVHGS